MYIKHIEDVSFVEHDEPLQRGRGAGGIPPAPQLLCSSAGRRGGGADGGVSPSSGGARDDGSRGRGHALYCDRVRGHEWIRKRYVSGFGGCIRPC